MNLQNGDEIAFPHITTVCHQSTLEQSSPLYLGTLLGNMKLIFSWHKIFFCHKYYKQEQKEPQQFNS